MTKRYTKLSETVFGLSSAFPNSNMVEAGFSPIDALLTNQQNRLDVGERGDLKLKLTNLQPNIHEQIKSHQHHPSHHAMCFLGRLLH